MSTLVFDIGTVGNEWNELSDASKTYLTQWTDEAEARERLGLSPLTGSICMLGVHDVERRQNSIYVVADSEDTNAYRARTEKELLEDFWEGARSYDVFVSFGGRRFDIPFLIHRSLALRVRPTIQFPYTRQLEKQAMPYHVDLHDQFSFYGDWRGPLSLHLLCEAYGLESPDEDGVTGKEVGEFFHKEKFADLAAYQNRLLNVTTTLYDQWKTNLAPPQFLNTLMS